MAVIAKWICDRDDSMFDSKKEAEAYDKQLELAENLADLLVARVPGVDQEKAGEFGKFLADNKEALIDACKGRVDALSPDTHQEKDNNNITSLMAGA